MKRFLTLTAIVLAACTSLNPMSSDIGLSEFDLHMQPSLTSGATTLDIQNDA
jgi:hypothetical protein